MKKVKENIINTAKGVRDDFFGTNSHGGSVKVCFYDKKRRIYSTHDKEMKNLEFKDIRSLRQYFKIPNSEDIHVENIQEK